MTYVEFFSLWLNKEAYYYREAHIISLGVKIALGFVSPSMEFYRSISDGEQEAILKKAQDDFSRSQRRNASEKSAG